MTGSGYILTNDTGQSILIDLGMFQGPPDIDRLNATPLDPTDIKNLSGAILTHAHTDHCGRLPLLTSRGFSGNIYMTAPTYELTKYSLQDSAKIQKSDKAQQLFTSDDVDSITQTFKILPYGKLLTIGNFSIRFLDAGHIIGSASIEIQADGRTILFSGDLGNSPEMLVQATQSIPRADTVIMESTYGDRNHPAGNPADVVANEIVHIRKSKGTLLIPAFSIERTQELLHIFNHLNPGIPVYLDSPMADYATEVYDKYRSLMNDEVAQDYRTEDGPFVFPELVTIKSHGASSKLGTTDGPKVIIAGSGMMTGGRMLTHAKELLPDPSTRLLIVGYQGEGTLGRELQEGSTDVVIQGHHVHVEATITDCQLMSAHADQSQLISWISSIAGVKHLILTHGEDSPRNTLKQLIHTKTDITDIRLPAMGEMVSL